jgi:hypothetical protein
MQFNQALNNMNLVENAIVSVFPTVAVGELSGQTRLGALPGWDSMNGVNLQIEIESAVGRTDLDLILTDKMTVQDVILELGKRGVAVA